MRRAVLIVIVLTACGNATPDTTIAAADSTTTATTAPAPTWQRIPNLPVARSEMPGAVIDGKIYIAGGYSSSVTGDPVTESLVEVFDPAAGSWSRVADMPEGRNHHMVAALDGYLYVFGGYAPDGRGTDTAWRYDPAVDEWTELVPLPTIVAAGGAVALDGALYVIGGSPNGLLCYRYDPIEEYWEEIAGMQQQRDHMSAAVADGRIYAIGGRWDAGELATVEIYDPAVGEWVVGPSLAEARGGLAAVPWQGTIAVIGGELIESRHTLDSVEILDLATGRWEVVEAIPTPLHGVAAVVVDDLLYVIGGSQRAAEIANAGDAFAGRP